VSSMIALLRRNWPLAALLASALVLAAAHAFEWAGYAPCALCLRQREVYWGAMAVAAVALVLPYVWRNPLLPRTMCAFLGVAFLAGLGVALYHAGVEYKWWAGPTGCSGTSLSFGTPESIAKAAEGKRIIVVPCDEAAWRDPVISLSMAGWNVLISGALAAFSFYAAARPIEGQARE
jgi:disulfide bond formation protein DsbB